MSKITIDLEDLKKYISTLDGNHDEWWMPEYDLYTTGIIRFFETVDEGFASKIELAVQEHSVIADRLEAERQGKHNRADVLKELLPEIETLFGAKYDTRGIPIGEAPTKTEGQGYEY